MSTATKIAMDEMSPINFHSSKEQMVETLLDSGEILSAAALQMDLPSVRDIRCVVDHNAYELSDRFSIVLTHNRHNFSPPHKDTSFSIKLPTKINATTDSLAVTKQVVEMLMSGMLKDYILVKREAEYGGS